MQGGVPRAAYAGDGRLLKVGVGPEKDEQGRGSGSFGDRGRERTRGGPVSHGSVGRESRYTDRRVRGKGWSG